MPRCRSCCAWTSCGGCYVYAYMYWLISWMETLAILEKHPGSSRCKSEQIAHRWDSIKLKKLVLQVQEWPHRMASQCVCQSCTWFKIINSNRWVMHVWECLYGITDQVDYKNSSEQQFIDSQLIQLKMPLQTPLQWIVPTNPDSSRLSCWRVSFPNVNTTFTKDSKH